MSGWQWGILKEKPYRLLSPPLSERETNKKNALAVPSARAPVSNRCAEPGVPVNGSISGHGGPVLFLRSRAALTRHKVPLQLLIISRETPPTCHRRWLDDDGKIGWRRISRRWIDNRRVHRLRRNNNRMRRF